jgi:hypothetical protein
MTVVTRYLEPKIELKILKGKRRNETRKNLLRVQMTRNIVWALAICGTGRFRRCWPLCVSWPLSQGVCVGCWS